MSSAKTETTTEQYYRIQRECNELCKGEFGNDVSDEEFSGKGEAVIMMEWGQFYQILEWPGVKKDGSDRIGTARNVHNIIGLHLTQIDKNKPLSRTNPYMVGLPSFDPKFNFYVKALLDKKYHVVIVNQVRNKKGELIGRKIAETISPSVNIDFVGQSSTNYVVCLNIHTEELPHAEIDRWKTVCGMSAIDVTSGKSYVKQAHSLKNDVSNALHETYRFIADFRPREIFVYLSGVSKEQKPSFILKLSKELGIRQDDCNLIVKSAIPKEYEKPSYQEKVLAKFFQSQSHSSTTFTTLSLFERLNMEQIDYARQSYVFLLQICFEMNDTMLTKIKNPTILTTNRFMELTHNCAQQLNVPELLKVIDKTKTMMGKRRLFELITNPLTNPESLEKSYTEIDSLNSMGKPA